MADQIFALQRDLDMVTEDVLNLKRSFGLLDYMAKVANDCQLEQLAQGAQMRRIEAKLDGYDARFISVESRLNSLEAGFEKMEKTLQLIVKHLGIKQT
jgi:hypothetical protein